MESEHLPDEPRWGSEHVNDLWEDMDTLNMLYEELMWSHGDVLEFVPDYKNDRIIIKNRSKEDEKLNDET